MVQISMWLKKQLIIKPQPQKLDWMQSHAMLPTIKNINGDLHRIYFSGRDKHNVSHIGYTNVLVNDGNINVLSYSSDPVLSPGERGCFDDNGVTPSCIIENKLFYIGWNSGTSTYRMSLIMGLAVENAEQFKRFSRAPLMPRTDREPFGICTAPFVMKEDGLYKMWYVSGEGWLNKDLPRYNIKYATSTDGIIWDRSGQVAVELQKGETALARPWVIQENKQYKMYFSYKIPEIGYRIGTAISNDGLKWSRSKVEELGVSPAGWDSEMVQYSCVFKHKGIKYMLYNGNGYGLTGIGYAVEK